MTYGLYRDAFAICDWTGKRITKVPLCKVQVIVSPRRAFEELLKSCLHEFCDCVELQISARRKDLYLPNQDMNFLIPKEVSRAAQHIRTFADTDQVVGRPKALSTQTSRTSSWMV